MKRLTLECPSVLRAERAPLASFLATCHFLIGQLLNTKYKKLRCFIKIKIKIDLKNAERRLTRLFSIYLPSSFFLLSQILLRRCGQSLLSRLESINQSSCRLGKLPIPMLSHLSPFSACEFSKLVKSYSLIIS